MTCCSCATHQRQVRVCGRRRPGPIQGSGCLLVSARFWEEEGEEGGKLGRGGGGELPHGVITARRSWRCGKGAKGTAAADSLGCQVIYHGCCYWWRAGRHAVIESCHYLCVKRTKNGWTVCPSSLVQHRKQWTWVSTGMALYAPIFSCGDISVHFRVIFQAFSSLSGNRTLALQ